MRCFATPCQALGSSPTFAVLHLATVAAKLSENREACDYSSISDAAQQLPQESNLEALKRERGAGRPLRIVSGEHLRQCGAQPHRFSAQDGLLDGCNLPWVH